MCSLLVWLSLVSVVRMLMEIFVFWNVVILNEFSSLIL